MKRTTTQTVKKTKTLVGKYEALNIIKETNQELIRELKTRVASKKISKQELIDLTESLICPRCGRRKFEPKFESEIKEIKQLLTLIVGKQKVNTS